MFDIASIHEASLTSAISTPGASLSSAHWTNSISCLHRVNRVCVTSELELNIMSLAGATAGTSANSVLILALLRWHQRGRLCSCGLQKTAHDSSGHRLIGANASTVSINVLSVHCNGLYLHRGP